MYENLIRMPEVRRMLGGVSRATIYAWQRQHGFPRGVHIGDRTVGWRPEQVRQWIEQRERRTAAA